MINLRTQSSGKSDEAYDMFYGQVDIAELAFWFMRIKEQIFQDDEIQKVITMVESKMYLVNDELLALESEMKEVEWKFKTIACFFETVIEKQQETQEKLQQAQINLRRLKNILTKNKIIELESYDEIFENLKAVECQLYSKHLINISQLLEEPVQQLESFVFQPFYANEQTNKQLLKEPIQQLESSVSQPFHENEQINQQSNILNSYLTLNQWQRFTFMQQFENYQNNLSLGHKGHVMAAEISPDEKLLASTGQDNILQLWNIETRIREAKYYSKEQLHAVCFSKSSKFIYSGQEGNLYQLLIAKNQLRMNNQILCHKKQIDYIMNIKDDLVVTYSIDGTIKVIDFTKYPKILRELIHNNQESRNFDYSEQYDFIVGSKQNKLVIWNQLNMSQLSENDQCYQQTGVIQVQLSPSSNKVLSISDKEPGIRLLHVNLDSLKFDLIQVVFTEIEQIWNISWGIDDDNFIFCERKYYQIINIPKWKKKKVIQANFSNKYFKLNIFRINLSKQIPSFRYLFSFLSDFVEILEYSDEVLTLCEGFLIQLMENENKMQ